MRMFFLLGFCLSLVSAGRFNLSTSCLTDRTDSIILVEDKVTQLQAKENCIGLFGGTLARIDNLYDWQVVQDLRDTTDFSDFMSLGKRNPIGIFISVFQGWKVARPALMSGQLKGLNMSMEPLIKHSSLTMEFSRGKLTSQMAKVASSKSIFNLLCSYIGFRSVANSESWKAVPCDLKRSYMCRVSGCTPLKQRTPRRTLKPTLSPSKSPLHFFHQTTDCAFDGDDFLIVDRQVYQPQAKADCEMYGGHLARVTDQDSFDAIAALILDAILVETIGSDSKT